MNIEYVKGIPYFDKVDGAIKQYPYLEEIISTDVLIIGGGISGAIAAYTFARAGVDCVLVDKGRMGRLNTSLATALLEYQLDDFADDLKSVMTSDEIANCYRMNLDGLGLLNDFIEDNGNKCHYAPRDTLIYTTAKCDKDKVIREYNFRRTHHFDCEYIDSKSNDLGFDLQAALRSISGGAECNPYLLTRQLLEAAEQYGAKIYENTEVIKLTKSGKGVVADISYQLKIRANRAILTTGYNTELLPNADICDRKLTYSIVTCPLEFKIHAGLLMHDTSVPYHYLRQTPDGRIIIGGEDRPYFGGTIRGNVAEKKYVNLLNYLVRLFPEIAGVAKIDYKFAGTFASTANNMGVIGETEVGSGIWCMYGYGANGIIYDFYGANMLLEKYHGVENANAYIFSPTRKVY